MPDEYTPTVEQAKVMFTGEHPPYSVHATERAAEFDRFLARRESATMQRVLDLVAAQRSAYPPSEGLNPAWIAGWRSSNEQVGYAITQAMQDAA